MPRYPNMGLSITDVRDLADIHILAMTSPAAAGQRFIAISDFMWMGEICTELRAKLGDKAAKVPTRQMPDVMLRLMAVVDKSVRNLTPLLGRKNLYTSARAQSVLGWKPRSPQITVTDCGASLIEHGVV